MHPDITFEHDFRTPSGSDPLTPSALNTQDSAAHAGSTVWNQGIIASYLNSHTTGTLSQSTLDDLPRVVVDITTDCGDEHSLNNSSYDDVLAIEGSDLETEGEPDLATLVFGSAGSEVVVDRDHPSLGTIDSVIEFLNAERDRVQAGRQADFRISHYSSPSDTAVHLEAQRSKRRRRKRPLKMVQILNRVKDVSETVSETTTTLTQDIGGDADRNGIPVSDPDLGESSSECIPTHYKSTPSTPPRAKPNSRVRDKLKHSKSTPALQVKTIPPDPQVLKLRCLAHKLRLKFPEDYERITALLTQDFSGGDSDFSDPRGPAPHPRDTLIHVFVDQLRLILSFLPS